MGPWRPRLFLASAVLLLACPGPAGAQSSYPEFSLTYDPCPVEVAFPAGHQFTLETVCTLTTSNNPDPVAGAQGWSLSMAPDLPLAIVEITVAGTTGASVTDDPPGLRDDGFKLCELSTPDSRCGEACKDLHGAVAAIVLSYQKVVTLPPEGSAPIARIAVVGPTPGEEGQRLSARVRYVDGCAGSGCSVDNVITWTGASSYPSLGECAFDVVALSSDIPIFRRGDPTGDGKVDISDAISILGCKFGGGACTTCRDAGDANDDGLMDISDPIYILSHLFLGGPVPVAPGPTYCGMDTTEDALPPCSYEGCP